jgi:NAD(P)-dependent dehydrogenase (short-subunit alcohol dehydrogenase family)
MGAMAKKINRDLGDATVLVTGGKGGIGQALADAFRSAGAVPITVDLPGTGADHEVDVTDADAMDALITGLDRLDVVVANAGIGVGGLVEDIDQGDWDRMIAVNIGGIVNTVLPAYERLRAQGAGAIVLMASVSGLVGTPLLTPYAMSKHAVVGLGASLGPEAARHGVSVTTVCPGPVDTSLLDVQAPTPGLDVRRYLTAAGGKPITAAALADEVVSAVRAGRSLVTPGRAKLLWRLNRFAPRLTAGEIAKGMHKELMAGGVEG